MVGPAHLSHEPSRQCDYEEGKMKFLTPIDPEIPLLESVVYAKDQPQYLPLPACRTADGEVVTRWKLNWRSRLAVVFGADLYVTLLTFNKPLTPLRVSIEKPVYKSLTFADRMERFKETFEKALQGAS